MTHRQLLVTREEPSFVDSIATNDSPATVKRFDVPEAENPFHHGGNIG